MDNLIWLLKIDAPQGALDRIQGLLAQDAGYGWEEIESVGGGTVFNVYAEQKELLEGIAADARAINMQVSTEISEAVATDWQKAWQQFFTPVEAGSRFVVLPPWLAHKDHASRTKIIIEPGNAFGTGHHASTTLCLAALSELLDEKRVGRNDWFLDLGTGTGILGLAACTAGMRGTGLDTDPVAIDNARRNRELNEAEDMELLKGGIEKIKGEKYDLVMANILAPVLIDLAPEIVSAMAEKGCLILGGILDSQTEEVAVAYKKLGLAAPRIFEEGEWRALLWA